MSNGDIRPQDHAAFKRLAGEGRLRMIEVSVALDADFLSFNLRPARLASSAGRRVDRAQGVPAGDLVRRRSAGDRQHGLPRRGRADLWSDHAGQPAVVCGRRAGVQVGRRARARSSSRPPGSRTATATACSKTPPATRRGSRSSRTPATCASASRRCSRNSSASSASRSTSSRSIPRGCGSGGWRAITMRSTSACRRARPIRTRISG